jgi:hypothetical protein
MPISIDTGRGEMFNRSGNLLPDYFPADASADLRAASNSSPGFQAGSWSVFAIWRVPVLSDRPL